MPRKLKVFRTPIGFHDAYVAAPSRKAALKAWGSDADLFARGVAEEVTDPQFMAEPLRRPGEVIRVSRGDLKAQLKALGARKPRTRTSAKPEASPAKNAAKPKPPPRRDKVDQAEAALAQARKRQADEVASLERQREALDRKIAALRAKQARELGRFQDRLDKARVSYRAALDKWSG
jgi:hypothetical protein